jgi:hypothetical protein
MDLATGLKRELESKMTTLSNKLNATKDPAEMKALISQRKAMQRAVAYLDTRRPAAH